jgi:hypothetical protein
VKGLRCRVADGTIRVVEAELMRLVGAVLTARCALESVIRQRSPPDATRWRRPASAGLKCSRRIVVPISHHHRTERKNAENG